jgi:hypothetical protein
LDQARFCAAPDDDTNASFRTKSQSFLHGTRNCGEWPDKLLGVVISVHKSASKRPQMRICREDVVLPGEIVMPATAMVDAALARLDRGEFATVPSLPNLADWNAYEAARIPVVSVEKN